MSFKVIAASVLCANKPYVNSSNTGKAYRDMKCIVMKENVIN